MQPPTLTLILYSSTPIPIFQTLDAAKTRLEATKEGRNSLKLVQADTYARQPDEWRALLRRKK